MMNHYHPAMDYRRSASSMPTGHYYPRQPSYFTATPSNPGPAASAETQVVSEALLTLSSVASVASKTYASSSATTSTRQSSSSSKVPSQHRIASAPRRVSLGSPAATSFAPQWPQPFVPQQASSLGNYETPKRAASPNAEAAAAAPPAKKVRTVSPINAPASNDDLSSCVSCVCPVCNQLIKGLGDQKVDWSQPIQGRQRAKTITAIKKHVKENHEDQSLWNVIVNSLDVTPSRASNDTQRVVTAQAFVHQALKKSALDSIPNQPKHLRSLRWTEKMIDQRVGIALGFVMYGGHEFLRGKVCTDENDQQINPKSLRNLAYSLIRGMHEELMERLETNESILQESMNRASLGLLRNRFQLLFAAPDKWSESWYMDPSKSKM